jgi:predicted Zn-dependent protease
MASTREERIASLEARLKQLKKHQQRVETRRRFLAARQDRREELRRKILIGETVMARLEAGERLPDGLRAWLDEAITRPDDRHLLDLGTEPSGLKDQRTVTQRVDGDHTTG